MLDAAWGKGSRIARLDAAPLVRPTYPHHAPRALVGRDSRNLAVHHDVVAHGCSLAARSSAGHDGLRAMAPPCRWCSRTAMAACERLMLTVKRTDGERARAVQALRLVGSKPRGSARLSTVDAAPHRPKPGNRGAWLCGC